MSGPRHTSDPSSPGGTGACYLADADHLVDTTHPESVEKPQVGEYPYIGSRSGSWGDVDT